MTTSNEDLMKMAKESLKDKWGLAIGTYLVYMILTGGFQGTIRYFPIQGLLSLVIAGPMALGSATFSLAIARNREAKFEQMFQGFNNFGTALMTYLLILLYVILWSLLLIVPGIIRAISYSMTFYIIADDPSIAPDAAMTKSMKMMDGYKMKFFYLCLNFLGWAILCILTLGIGFLWLIPYASVSMANFYDDVKGEWLRVNS